MPSETPNGVFVNCPFDDRYAPLFLAIVFAVHECGFVARCALELSDATTNRYQKILGLIGESRYGIHDISRTELGKYSLPRFNMPLELGIFLGCKAFGDRSHRAKACLIFDRRPYRYQKFISDISGQDVVSHDGQIGRAITGVRDWLSTQSRRAGIPGGAEIRRRYLRFQRELPAMAAKLKVRVEEMTFFDYSNLVLEWLGVEAPA